jgi:hypothetical protein
VLTQIRADPRQGVPVLPPPRIVPLLLGETPGCITLISSGCGARGQHLAEASRSRSARSASAALSRRTARTPGAHGRLEGQEDIIDRRRRIFRCFDRAHCEAQTQLSAFRSVVMRGARARFPSVEPNLRTTLIQMPIARSLF